jgi:hypothetical protein
VFVSVWARLAGLELGLAGLAFGLEPERAAGGTGHGQQDHARQGQPQPPPVGLPRGDGPSLGLRQLRLPQAGLHALEVGRQHLRHRPAVPGPVGRLRGQAGQGQRDEFGIGVALDREVATSLDGQGEWGGNLDIRDVAPGNRILLPVFHPGGRFYLGDVHASQADTEFTGTAAETQATVRLKLDVIKGKRVPWLRIEKPQSIVSVFAYRPLEVAVETATVNQMDWLITDFGFTPTDAYCLVSTCPDFRIHVYQMCKVARSWRTGSSGSGSGPDAGPLGPSLPIPAPQALDKRFGG